MPRPLLPSPVVYGHELRPIVDEHSAALDALEPRTADLEAASVPGFDSLPLMLADTALAYSNVSAGDFVRGGEHFYEVVGQGETDYHLATAGGVKLKTLDAGLASAHGANGAGAANDAPALATALNNTSAEEYRHLRLGSLHRVDSAIEIANDSAITGRTQSLTAQSRVYASGNFPIFRRTSGYNSRLILEALMLHGQMDGSYSGTGATNTAPLLSLDGGGAYLEAHRVTFRLAAIGFRHTSGVNWQRWRDSKFDTISDKGAHLVGARHALFEGCDFENCGWAVYAEPSLAFGGGSLGSQKVIIRDCYTETANFFLDCAVPEITGSYLGNAHIWIGKNAVSPVIKANSHVIGCAINLPPKFHQDVEAYGFNAINTKTQTNFPIPALPTFSDISGATGYVAGDGLDYFVATQVKPNSTYAYDSGVTVSFNRDGSPVSTDTGYLIQSNNNADDDGGRTDLALTTYGVIENTGAAMSVTTAGTDATPKQRTVFIQSLLKNGSLAGGAATNWRATGTVTVSTVGAYTRLVGATNSDQFAYDRIIHLPENTETLLVAARVKAGSTGTVAMFGLRCGKWSNFFDNGDGTFDDLWLQYVYVKGDRTISKSNLRVYRYVGETGFDVSLRWVAAVPLIAGGAAKRYVGTFTWDPASVAAGATATTTVMSDGSTSNDFKLAQVGDHVRIVPPYDLQGMTVTGHVSATGQITVRLQNPTAGAIDLGSGSWRWELVKQ